MNERVRCCVCEKSNVTLLNRNGKRICEECYRKMLIAGTLEKILVRKIGEFK